MCSQCHLFPRDQARPAQRDKVIWGREWKILWAMVCGCSWWNGKYWSFFTFLYPFVALKACRRSSSGTSSNSRRKEGREAKWKLVCSNFHVMGDAQWTIKDSKQLLETLKQIIKKNDHGDQIIATWNELFSFVSTKLSILTDFYTRLNHVVGNFTAHLDQG